MREPVHMRWFDRHCFEWVVVRTSRSHQSSKQTILLRIGEDDGIRTEAPGVGLQPWPSVDSPSAMGRTPFITRQPRPVRRRRDHDGEHASRRFPPFLVDTVPSPRLRRGSSHERHGARRDTRPPSPAPPGVTPRTSWRPPRHATTKSGSAGGHAANVMAPTATQYQAPGSAGGQATNVMAPAATRNHQIRLRRASRHERHGARRDEEAPPRTPIHLLVSLIRQGCPGIDPRRSRGLGARAALIPLPPSSSRRRCPASPGLRTRPSTC